MLTFFLNACRPLDATGEIDFHRRAGRPGCVLRLRQVEAEDFSDVDGYYNLALAYEDMRMYVPELCTMSKQAMQLISSALIHIAGTTMLWGLGNRR